MDCEFINERFAQQFLSDSSNINLAKKVVRLSLAYDCKEYPSFFKAAQKVQQEEPSNSLGLLLAVFADKQGKWMLAERYYKQALNLTSEPEMKATILYTLATHYQKRKLKSLSRKYALKAIAYNSNLLKGYELIGDLYWTSAEECTKGESRVDDRSIYIAAYEMYEKAAQPDKMAAAREQFPSINDIFYELRKEGESVRVGCWINETVTLRRRPAPDRN